MPAGAALDHVAHAQGAELVADGDDVVLLVRGERDVVHARAVAAGHGGVVHGRLAAHPRGVGGAGLVLDVLRDAEAEVLHVLDRARHVGRDLVEVVEPHQGARRVEVVPPGEALHVLDVVEELVREAERVLHADAVADALGEALRTPLDAAAELGVERDGAVEVLRRAHAVRECGDRGDRPLAQHEVVVDELLEAPQVDGVLVLLGHDEIEHVHVEVAAGLEVGDHDLHVRAADDVRRGGVRGRDAVDRCRDRVGQADHGLRAVGGDAHGGASSALSAVWCRVGRVAAGQFAPNRAVCTGPSVMCTACWSV